MSSIKLSVESFDAVYDEVEPLLIEHYEEIAHRKDKIKFNPDRERYRMLEGAGVLHIVVARDKGELVGYFVSFIAPHLHYQETTVAQNDVLFVRKDYRGSSVALRLFQFAEAKLKELGVDCVVLHMKVDYPFEKFAEALNYKKFEYNYIKYLE